MKTFGHLGGLEAFNGNCDDKANLPGNYNGDIFKARCLFYDAISPSIDMYQSCTPREVAYLSDAAHLLRQAAPETSARLMRVRNGLLLHASGGILRSLSDVQRQSACTACGNIFVPGSDGDTLRIKPAGPAQRRRKHRATVAARLAASGENNGKTTKAVPKDAMGVVEWGVTKIFTCGRCRSVTRIRIPAPPRVTRTTKEKARYMQTRTQEQTQTPAKSLSDKAPLELSKPAEHIEPKHSANAASKQRKKSRKAGLQALLAGQKASSQPKSFSLSDFKK